MNRRPPHRNRHRRSRGDLHPLRSIRGVRGGLAVAIGVLGFCASATAAPLPVPAADSLLSQAREELWAGREQASIPLFRSYLEHRPQDTSAHLDLAHALAWSGFLSAAASAYEAAEADRGPQAATRAGLAELNLWSGRKVEARRFLRESVQLGGEEPRLFDLLRQLESESRLRTEVDFERVTDSDHLEAGRAQIRVRSGPAAAWSPRLTLWQERLERRPGTGSVDGSGAAAGLQVSPGHGWTMTADAGATRSTGQEARTWTEVSALHRSLRGFSLTLRHAFGDAGFALKSVAARRDGLMAHDASVSGYRALGSAGGWWGRARVGEVSDGNRSRGADLAADFRVWRRDRRWLPSGRLLAGASYFDYDQESPRYYAPREEWTLAGGGLLTLLSTTRGELSARVSAGPAGNAVGHGRLLSAQVDGSWTLGPARVTGQWLYGESIQRGRYLHRTARLGLEWRF